MGVSRRELLVRGGTGALALGLLGSAPAFAATGLGEARRRRGIALVEGLAARGLFGADASRAEAFVDSVEKAYVQYPYAQPALDEMFDALPSSDGKDFADVPAAQRVPALTGVVLEGSRAPFKSQTATQTLAIYNAIAAVQTFFGTARPNPELILMEGF